MVAELGLGTDGCFRVMFFGAADAVVTATLGQRALRRLARESPSIPAAVGERGSSTA